MKKIIPSHNKDSLQRCPVGNGTSKVAVVYNTKRTVCRTWMIHSGLVDDVVGSVFNKFALGTLSIVYHRNKYILGLLYQ